MRHIKFKIETDEEVTGEVGIVPSTAKNWAGYIPTQPRGLSHDLLDHCTNEHGYFYEELAALGGSALTRNFGVFFPTRYTPYPQIFAWDITSSMRDNQDITDAPKYRLSKKDENRWNSLLTEIRPLAVESWDSEFKEDFGYGDDEIQNFFEDDETWKQVCDWVKYGYARAKRRFRDCDSAFALFQAIEQTVSREWNSLLQWADTGKEFTLVLDYSNGYARVDGDLW